jgi:hypothetical protein
MAVSAEQMEGLCKLLLLALVSNEEGEILNAMRALQQKMHKESISAHDLLANITESKGYTEEQAVAIYKRGGDDREAQIRTTPAYEIDRNFDGTVSDRGMALFCTGLINKLDVRHHDFIQKMASKTSAGYSISLAQRNYLKSLYYQIGGKP